jgi:hypothetical protein
METRTGSESETDGIGNAGVTPKGAVRLSSRGKFEDVWEYHMPPKLWKKFIVPSTFTVKQVEEIAANHLEVEAKVVSNDEPAAAEEKINHPKHYNKHPSGVECIVVAEYFNFCLGNTIKYIWRAGEKQGASALEDLEKAQWYLEREISKLRAQTNS